MSNKESKTEQFVAFSTSRGLSPEYLYDVADRAEEKGFSRKAKTLRRIAADLIAWMHTRP